jgi:thymidine phosphorylase
VAIHQERDRHGKPWAHLCQEHHAALEQALDSGDAKKTLSTWVKAQGRDRFMESMKPAIDTMVRLAQFAQSLQRRGRSR